MLKYLYNFTELHVSLKNVQKRYCIEGFDRSQLCGWQIQSSFPKKWEQAYLLPEFTAKFAVQTVMHIFNAQRIGVDVQKHLSFKVHWWYAPPAMAQSIMCLTKIDVHI